MAYNTEFIDEGSGILHVGQGVLTGREIIEALKTLAADPQNFESITHGLIDLTEVAELHVSMDEVKIITEIDRGSSNIIRRARVAIAAPEDLMFGTSRMYAGMMHTPGWTIEVFRTMDQARAWLYSHRPLEVKHGGA